MRMLTLEKKTIPPLLPEVKSATLQWLVLYLTLSYPHSPSTYKSCLLHPHNWTNIQCAPKVLLTTVTEHSLRHKISPG